MRFVWRGFHILTCSLLFLSTKGLYASAQDQEIQKDIQKIGNFIFSKEDNSLVIRNTQDIQEGLKVLRLDKDGRLSEAFENIPQWYETLLDTFRKNEWLSNPPKISFIFPILIAIKNEEITVYNKPYFIKHLLYCDYVYITELISICNESAHFPRNRHIGGGQFVLNNDENFFLINAELEVSPYNHIRK